MSDSSLDKFQAALAERAAKKQANNAFKRIKEASYADDLVPAIQFERKPEDDLIDGVLGKLSVVDAYVKWCGKMRPKRRPGQTEGVMISCPIPGHRDADPSAWGNTEKNTWFCGGCNTGGDIYDIAAFKFGLPVPGYKTGKQFHDLRRQMVVDLGYVVQQSDDKTKPDHIYKPEPVPVPTAAPTAPPAAAPVETVEPTPTSPDFNDEDLDDLEREIFPSLLDWRLIVPGNTFIHDYMTACIIDDCAEEYHFWNAMVAVGLAVGRKITLEDFNPVYGNLLLCLLGQSGDRKSRSLKVLKKLIEFALPYDHRSDTSEGVKPIQGRASGEALIKAFFRPIYDSTSSKVVLDYSQIRGMVEFPEFSSFVHRTERQGSTLKDTLLQFSDTDDYISTGSVTHGEIFARNAFASIISTTQPESLQHLISDEDTGNGFLNRWLFAQGRPKHKIAIGGSLVDLVTSVKSLQRVHAQIPRRIYWSEDAERVFTEHFHDVLVPVQHENPILTRLDLLQKKIILLLAINENLTMVTKEVVERTILLHPYLVSTYGITARSVVKQSINTEIYDELLRHIKRLTPQYAPWGPTKKHIKDRISRKKWDPQIVQRLFELLAKDDDVEITQGDPNKPGRKADHFRWIGE